MREREEREEGERKKDSKTKIGRGKNPMALFLHWCNNEQNVTCDSYFGRQMALLMKLRFLNVFFWGIFEIVKKMSKFTVNSMGK